MSFSSISQSLDTWEPRWRVLKGTMRIRESQYPVTLFSATNYSPLSLKGDSTHFCGWLHTFKHLLFSSVFSGTQPHLPFCKAHSALPEASLPRAQSPSPSSVL